MRANLLKLYENRLSRRLLSVLGGLILVGCGKEEIKVYSAPKEIASAPRMNTAQNQISADPGAAPIHWTTPPTWKELEPTSMRVGNFLVSNGDKKAEVSVIPFPGDVGTELSNVNRWRKEIGLNDIGESDVVAEDVSIGAAKGKLYDLSGAELQTIAAILEKDGTSWFYKMRGDKELVTQNKPAFVEFLKSIHFDSVPHAHEQLAGATPASTNAKKVPEENSSREPKWDAPAGWTATAPTPMVLKSFSAGDAEHEAKISITMFPGDVGGPLANVNRWRGQLSLEPIDASELAKATTSIDVLGGKATLVELAGTDGKTGQPARMIAAMVPREGRTWFYKMLGDPATVTAQKESFEKFVQTVRYPND